MSALVAVSRERKPGGDALTDIPLRARCFPFVDLCAYQAKETGEQFALHVDARRWKPYGCTMEAL